MRQITASRPAIVALAATIVASFARGVARTLDLIERTVV
jgi:hypothetical protein